MITLETKLNDELHTHLTPSGRWTVSVLTGQASLRQRVSHRLRVNKQGKKYEPANALQWSLYLERRIPLGILAQQISSIIYATDSAVTRVDLTKGQFSPRNRSLTDVQYVANGHTETINIGGTSK